MAMRKFGGKFLPLLDAFRDFRKGFLHLLAELIERGFVHLRRGALLQVVPETVVHVFPPVCEVPAPGLGNAGDSTTGRRLSSMRGRGPRPARSRRIGLIFFSAEVRSKMYATCSSCSNHIGTGSLGLAVASMMALAATSPALHCATLQYSTTQTN